MSTATGSGREMMGAGFLLDSPVFGAVLVASYAALAVFLAWLSGAVRNRVAPGVRAPSP